MINIFVGVPTHDGRLDHKTAERIYNSISQKYNRKIVVFQSSLLTFNMNTLLAMALNERKTYDFKYFAMLHSDIVPEKYWLDKLIDEAEAHQADMMAAVAPFKDGSGITSTGILAENTERYPFARLTLKQILHPAFPDTFDAALANKLPEPLKIADAANIPNPVLLANTGACVVRIDKPWAEELIFQFYDHLQLTDERLHAWVEPEDWNFSSSIQHFGGKVMATRKLKLQHVGSFYFDNHYAHGHDRDPQTTTVTIWSLDDAQRLHLHSPTLAEWMLSYFPDQLPVYDFGCGKGTYINYLNENGYKVWGLEGTEGIEAIADSEFVFGGMDITKPLDQLSRESGLPLGYERGTVISLEVMEHLLPGQQEQTALENITRCVADDGLLVLSWAVPGQPGHGHNNCRPADYVVPRIEAFGFKLHESLTASARKAGGSDLNFFYETIYVFKRV